MNFLIVFREKITKLELEKTELLEELEELREKVHTKTETHQAKTYDFTAIATPI